MIQPYAPFDAAVDRYVPALAAMPADDAVPAVVLTEADRAEMATVNVRSLRAAGVDEAAMGTSWDELFLAWRAHSRWAFGCAWKAVDGSPLMFSHVASAVHILRSQAVEAQAA